ncbi:MAG: PDZ domain-containing protein [Pirellulaceae bacterium]|nr:PDZ domain-containing protein [Pirellulaceae bacterium]
MRWRNLLLAAWLSLLACPELSAQTAPDGQPAQAEPPQPAEPSADATPAVNPDWLRSFQWRSLGPATMGGRIVDLAVVESNPSTFYVATATGGLFKTTNNGTTFSAVFDRESTVSIGDVCVAPSDPQVVWVGTGEHNARNSVSWGDGVYKSIDGGKSWQHMGLPESYQIGRMAIHPENPDIVYVGALGRLWGPSAQRGLYKTTDGGTTWEQVLFVDERTGCVDVAMHPEQPDTLLVAMYERQRDQYDVGDPAKRWGPGSGLYKTTDGGQNWKRLTAGLPDRPLGRIGIDYFRSDPNLVMAIVESDKIATGPVMAYMGIASGQADDGPVLRDVLADGPAVKAGLKARDRILEIDGQKLETYNDLIAQIRGHKPGDKVQMKVRRGEDEELTVELTFGQRGGGNTALPFASSLGGQRANAQRQQGPDGFQTGGVFKSTDGGETWTRVNSLNPRPFYYSQIRIDPSDANWVYVLGIQLHVSSDGGATFETAGSRVHPDHHALWIHPGNGSQLILGCDGGLYMSYDRGQTWGFHDIMAIGQFYHVAVDNRRPYRVYGGLQDNGSWGGPSRTRAGRGPANWDWVRVGGGDGFVCQADPADPDWVYYESQYGRMGRVNVSTGERARFAPATTRDGPRYRFNWKTPFLLSHQNSRIFYCAGNVVFRSLNRGDDLRPISPQITRTDRGSATALAESPRDPNVLYVGTDDGALWGTRNGGQTWEDLTERVGLLSPFHVASIETSRFETGRAYVAFDGHRHDNDDPHVYVTEDFGQSWRPLRANLPSGSSRVLREDVENSDLLYLGTEFGIWVSLDRGQQWFRFNNNLPTVAVHEVAVHPTQGEIVAATHGRSLWALDVTTLRQLSGKLVSSPAHLFRPGDGVLWSGALASSTLGHRQFIGQNPEFGAPLYYFLAEATDDVALEVLDIQGNVVRKLRAQQKAGLHRVVWDLRHAPPEGRNAPQFGPPVEEGIYLLRLTAGSNQLQQPLRVLRDPEFPAALLTEELEELEESRQRYEIE